MTKASPAGRESGMMLVVVLWFVASLSLLVSAFNVSVRGSAAIAGNEVSAARAVAMADAGIELAVAQLIQKTGAATWRADGSRNRTRFAGADLVVSIIDENGRVDLNKSDIETLRRLLRKFAPSDRAADDISGFILDQRLLAEGGATQSGGQVGEGLAAAPRPGMQPAFMDVTQLRDAPRMTARLFAALQPWITVHNATGKINALTAPHAVLLAVPGLSASDVETLLARRLDAGKELLRNVSQAARKLLSTDAGPAYTITVNVSGAGLAAGLKRKAIVMIGKKGQAPYYGLSLRPDGF